jgi:hypothetical protein
MAEGFETVAHFPGWKIMLRKRKMFTKAVYQTKAAVCPDCGEISLYIDDPAGFREDIK